MDYYEILGIGPSATDEEIRKAYRKAALRTHPDKNPDRREEAEAEFKCVSNAFQILSDARSRFVYDQLRHSSSKAPSSQQSKSQQQQQQSKPASSSNKKEEDEECDYEDDDTNQPRNGFHGSGWHFGGQRPPTQRAKTDANPQTSRRGHQGKVSEPPPPPPQATRLPRSQQPPPSPEAFSQKPLKDPYEVFKDFFGGKGLKDLLGSKAADKIMQSKPVMEFKKQFGKSQQQRGAAASSSAADDDDDSDEWIVLDDVEMDTRPPPCNPMQDHPPQYKKPGRYTQQPQPSEPKRRDGSNPNPNPPRNVRDDEPPPICPCCKQFSGALDGRLCAKCNAAKIALEKTTAAASSGAVWWDNGSSRVQPQPQQGPPQPAAGVRGNRGKASMGSKLENFAKHVLR